MMLYRRVTVLSSALRAIAMVFVSLVSASAMSATHAATTHEYKLANGLKLVVKEDHRSPVVISQIWYKAGSIDEVNGVTGVAHVLEHMMFKGTKKFPGSGDGGAATPHRRSTARAGA